MMPPKPNYNRGDVVLVLFPNSNRRTAKTRPALIIQADNLQTGLPQVIVAMITSRVFRANHPSRVLIEQSTPIGQQSGLLADSVVMTDNLATVAEAAIDRVIGMLPMADVDPALRQRIGKTNALFSPAPLLGQPMMPAGKPRAARHREGAGARRWIVA